MFIYIIIIICAVWWISKYFHNQNLKARNTYQAGNDEEEKEMEISDELIFNVQSKFEEHITQTYLPDSLSGQEIYIYKELMRKWYSLLDAKFRYDTNKLQKIRKDWLEYLDNLVEQKTYSFMYFETENEEKKKEYDKNWGNANKKVITLENAFASLVGQEAVEKLESIRKLNIFSFKKDGDMAPTGFIFGLSGELIKQGKRNK